MIDLVALDADDTLWHTEPLYRTVREQFRSMLARYDATDRLDERLDEVEHRNLQHFGYGVKGFVRSMIETGLDMTGDRLEGADVRRIVAWGTRCSAPRWSSSTARATPWRSWPARSG